MKRIFAIILTLSLSLSLFGCAKQSRKESEPSAPDAVGRGSDVTIRSVDYAVELNETETGGSVVAAITRQDYDETAGDWRPINVTDIVEFPSELTGTGARFSHFEWIW